MPDERKSILLRISPALWASLSRWAADDLRSLNAQIEFVLREAVRARHKGTLPDEGTIEPPKDEPTDERTTP
jgi:hypothetical protein